jgi:hypothetical protein
MSARLRLDYSRYTYMKSNRNEENCRKDYLLHVEE